MSPFCVNVFSRDCADIIKGFIPVFAFDVACGFVYLRDMGRSVFPASVRAGKLAVTYAHVAGFAFQPEFVVFVIRCEYYFSGQTAGAYFCTVF
jgi:hypothetical protein